MNKLELTIQALTNEDPNKELVADLISGVLRSVGIQVAAITFTKVAEAETLHRRVRKSSTPTI